MKILLIEDEIKVSEFITKGLQDAGHQITTAVDGERGLQLALDEAFDLVILDWMLPKKDGLEVCQALRQDKGSLPILMLTAKDSIDNKVAGLQSGADDYLTKPFFMRELQARIGALSRRVGYGEVLTLADLKVDLLNQQVERANKAVYLSRREFDLLVFFMRNRNRTLSRTTIGKQVWGIKFDTGTNYVDVYINYLRKKLHQENARALIYTIRGKGYMMMDIDD